MHKRATVAVAAVARCRITAWLAMREADFAWQPKRLGKI